MPPEKTPENSKKRVIITYGTFDLLHIGHINILRRAKSLGDYLIVGVTGEDYDRGRGKLNVSQSLAERVKAVEETGFADQIIIEHHRFQKQADIQKFGVDAFVIGDDWFGKFDALKEFCEVVYLPRTDGISSTLLRSTSRKTVSLGIVGTGRIAKRFATEATHISSLDMRAVYSRSAANVAAFCKSASISFGYNDFQEFLNCGIDAVYIASPHQEHYAQAKLALEAGKHVLCEKPITLKASELEELMDLAKSKNLILLEAVKTAFFEAFTKLRRDVENGKIGRVVEVRASFTKLIADRTAREWQAPFGGAVNELASYPLLLIQSILGSAVKVEFHSISENGVDAFTNIIGLHENGARSIATVGIGAKTEGCAIISGTKGYIYIPAPWWLTKTYSIRFEDPSMEEKYVFDLDGDGLRYEIAEFVTLIMRQEVNSSRLTSDAIKGINSVISQFNDSVA
jgi:glycerol-3-phosphate cytidylyltransferase